ncbi:hypothetical protein EJ08DRAFT_660779 [Tothia fuscella]|uniref:F-box domain-containing protein n=1 Tax=Tothia fuscella TaxID=1048955 RepID=A0A9P4NSF2_9PEZI|nr:hypothetical protein EJ08DRAFT_660779 [Tothia fuscella]
MSSTSILDLPIELKQMVAGYLENKDLCSLRLVNREMAADIDYNFPFLMVLEAMKNRNIESLSMFPDEQIFEPISYLAYSFTGAEPHITPIPAQQVWPNLTEFAVKGHQFQYLDVYDLIKFLGNHRRTLRTLKLCQLTLRDNNHLPHTAPAEEQKWIKVCQFIMDHLNLTFLKFRFLRDTFYIGTENNPYATIPAAQHALFKEEPLNLEGDLKAQLESVVHRLISGRHTPEGVEEIQDDAEEEEV